MAVGVVLAAGVPVRADIVAAIAAARGTVEPDMGGVTEPEYAVYSQGLSEC